MSEFLTADQQREFQRNANESELTFADRVGKLLRAAELDHPYPQTLFDFAEGEQDLVNAYTSETSPTL